MRQNTWIDAFFIFFDANFTPFHRVKAVILQPEILNPIF